MERELVLGELLDRQMDRRAIETQLVRLRTSTVWLSPNCTLLFLLTFVCAPVSYYGINHLGIWSARLLIVGWILAWLGIVVQYGPVRRALCPESFWQRVWHVFAVCLSPASAMRTAEAVSRDLLSEFHPLAVAAVVCPRERFIALAAVELRALRNPSPADCLPADTDAGRAEAWFREQTADRLENALREHGVDLAELLAPPPRADDALAYCPRCLNQFVFETGNCADCGGIALQPFESERPVDHAVAPR